MSFVHCHILRAVDALIVLFTRIVSVEWFEFVADTSCLQRHHAFVLAQ